MVKEYSLKKDGAVQLSPHFKVREFKSGDGADRILIDSDLVTLLEKLYAEVEKRGYPVKRLDINSGYRTVAYDKSPAVGGYGGGQHVLGKAADLRVCVGKKDEYTETRGVENFLKGSLLCCYLQDLGCQGIGYIGGVAAHADTRKAKWWGDEQTHNDRVSDWYSYFGITRPGGTPETVPHISYQVYTKNGPWLPYVVDTNDFAGIPGKSITCVRAFLTTGHVKYRTHTGGRWLPWVSDKSDYAGIPTALADGVQMQITDLPGYAIEYRVSAIGRDYFPWVRNYGEGSNGYAGSFGKPFDRLQCRIVRV